MTQDDNRKAHDDAPARKGLRALWPLIGAHPWLFASWLISLAVATGATLLVPAAMATLIDGGFVKPRDGTFQEHFRVKLQDVENRA